MPQDVKNVKNNMLKLWDGKTQALSESEKQLEPDFTVLTHKILLFSVSKPVNPWECSAEKRPCLRERKAKDLAGG